jgi:small-conductance mechanosensitive channel
MLKKIIMYAFCVLFTTEMAFAQSIKSPGPVSSVPASSPVVSLPQIEQSKPGFPVRFADTYLFLVSTSPIGSLTPENRAQLIRNNIQSFADSQAEANSLKLIPLPEGIGIGNDDNMLMVITAQEAETSGKTRSELAQTILERIQAAIVAYRSKQTWKTYGLGAGLTLISIIGLWLALHWNNRAFAWLKSRASGMQKSWGKGLHFKEVEVLSAGRIENVLLMFLKSLRIFVMLLCWDFFLPLILSFFPETRKLGAKIFGYLITPFSTIFQTIVKYIPNLFYIFVIGVIAFYTIKLISYVFMLIERGELKFDWFYEDWALPTYQIIRFLVIVTALISAYPYIPGSSSEAFQGIGLVLGAIISFASSSAISNIVAGIILTYTRAFRLNDRIKLGDTTGDVVEKTLLVTRIKTIKHVIVTIPNSLVMGAQIINYSTSAAEGAGVILHTSVTIGYDVPWLTVQSLLVEAAIATERLLKTPPPFVLQTSLDDFYVSYEINAYTKQPENMAVIYSDLHQNILKKFDDAGVEIMSPHYYAMRDGNASTVPSVLTTGGYAAPAFQIVQAGNKTA